MSSGSSRLDPLVFALPRVSIHALRHTNASSLIEAGLDVLTISRRLGHGSAAIMLTVDGHLFSNKGGETARPPEMFATARTE